MIRTILAVTAAMATAGATLVAAPATAASFNTLTGDAPIVIAHRGASGYLPEHTLAAYELAMRQGADFIEPDLLLTRDGHLVAMHDTTLTRTTNVMELFPNRPGGYAVSNFDLAEIRQLTVQPTSPQASFEFPGFTPSMPDPFRVPTFEEILTFLNDYNTTNGTSIGIYPEAKNPTSTLMNRQIVEQLRDAGFTSAADQVFIQSFNFGALREIAAIQDELGTDMLQVALGSPLNLFGWRLGTTPLSEVATFASGVGVPVNSASQAFVDAAHALGLLVHVYTLRPLSQDASDTLTEPLILRGVDGFFTDYTDRTLATLTPFLPDPLDDGPGIGVIPLPMTASLLPAALLLLFGLRRRRTA